MDAATRQEVRKQRFLTEFLKRRWIDAEVAKLELAETSMEVETPPPLPLLPHELYDLILISLPAKSLLRLQLVCKEWFTLINSSFFIQAHARQFETLLISKLPTSRQFKDGRQRSWFHFLSLEDGGSSFLDQNESNCMVQASCDGLILACQRYGFSLGLLNPLTRQEIELPEPIGRGRSPPYRESFGMAYCNEARSYKVVHVFRRNYEILTVGSGKWRLIEGPQECILLREGPVSIGGSLHWLSSISNRTVTCVSMNVSDEKFVCTRVPAAGAKIFTGDKLVEIEGDLGYVAHEEVNLLHVWILSGGCWMKRYSIRTTFACLPICCRRKGKEMVLENFDDHRLYAYDLERDELKPVISPGCDDEQPGFGPIRANFFPHRPTLVSII